MRLQRPRHLLSCAVLGASLLLGACGFHLRGTGVSNIKLDELHVSTKDSFEPIRRSVLEALRINGVAVNSAAPYQLHLAERPAVRRALSHTQRSMPAEYELSQELTVQITNRTGQLLAGPATLTARRTYVSDRDNLVASSEEEALLKREMRQDLTRQLMFLLSAVSPSDLEARESTLERPAD